MSLGDQIAARRRILKLSQPVLADQARLGLSTIRKLESGERENVTVRTLAQLGAPLQCKFVVQQDGSVTLIEGG